MSKCNISHDLSVVTTIPKLQIDNLISKAQMLMCHNIYENIIKQERVAHIDIGIGTLQIMRDDENIKYKFVPSLSFNNQVKSVFEGEESPLIDCVENRLKDRIINTYKDIL